MQRFVLRVDAQPDGQFDALNAAAPSDAAAAMLRRVTPDDGKEHLVALALDTRGDVLGYEVIASGTVDACMLYPRDVWAWLLHVPMARFVALAHNHPSGKVDLSPQDKVGSAVCARVGRFVGLDLAWSMVFTHRSERWEVWQPEAGKGKAPRPEPDGEDQRPEQPQEPEPGEELPEPEPEPAPEDEPDEDDDAPDGEDDDPGETPDGPDGDGEDEDDGQPEPDKDGPPDELGGPESEPAGGQAVVTPEVSLDAVRAALRRVVGK